MESKVNNYLENIELLKSSFGWKMSAVVRTLIASIYVMNDQKLDVNSLQNFSTYITKQVNWFSPFRTHQKYNVAAYLLCKFTNLEDKFTELYHLYKELTKNKLPKNAYTVICAMSLLNENIDDIAIHVCYIKEIYQKMRKMHFFLTSHSDYPLAALLSIENNDLGKLMEGIEYYYTNLNLNGFTKGNDLQFLSHILMLVDSKNKDNLIAKVTLLKENLINHEIKIRRMHYSAIGLLASVDITESDYVKLKELIDKFNHHRLLKQTKSLNTIVAVMLLMSEKIDNPKLAETNLSTTIETIIQAQNAAMIAAISSTSAVSVSASTN